MRSILGGVCRVRGGAAGRSAPKTPPRPRGRPIQRAARLCPFGPDLLALYGASHAFLHSSWTEDFRRCSSRHLRWACRRSRPTSVEYATLNGRVRLIPPNDADAAARELTAVARDPNLRARLIGAGHEYVRSRTLSREAGRVARLFSVFLVSRQTTQAPSSKHSIPQRRPTLDSCGPSPSRVAR